MYRTGTIRGCRSLAPGRGHDGGAGFRLPPLLPAARPRPTSFFHNPHKPIQIREAPSHFLHCKSKSIIPVLFRTTLYLDMVDLVERINVLLEQEKCSYETEDYLAPGFQQRLRDDLGHPHSHEFLSCSSGSTSTSGINEVWREKICEWSYQVIDHFDFSREIVSIAVSYLDRYLSRRPVNKKHFQLLAMSCLYLAIKLYEPGTVSMKSMIDLSRGYFLVEHMVEMEMSILRALSWKVHPPTSYCFTKHILFLLPYTSVTMDVRYDILELTRFLTELSVIDYYFVGQRPSAIGLAALFNAMEAIPGVSESAIEDLTVELMRLPALDPTLEDVQECRKRLRVLYAQGGYERPETLSDIGTRNDAVSPVCVSYGISLQDMGYEPIAPPPENEGKQNNNSFVHGVDCEQEPLFFRSED